MHEFTQGSTFAPLLFLIYIYSDDSSNAKITSLFSVVHNVNTSEDEVNYDLVKINKWACQWKISFNPDTIKQAQEVIFTTKISKKHHTRTGL